MSVTMDSWFVRAAAIASSTFARSTKEIDASSATAFALEATRSATASGVALSVEKPPLSHCVFYSMYRLLNSMMVSFALMTDELISMACWLTTAMLFVMSSTCSLSIARCSMNERFSFCVMASA